MAWPKGRPFTDEHRSRLSAAQKGRVITWGAKISEAKRGRTAPRRSVEDRFWPKVDKTDGCWLWRSAIDTSGYGVMSSPEGKLYAHRVSYELANGPVPEGLEVRHACDVRACVNPGHLSVGTRADNVQDMVSRGRTPGGPHRGATHCIRGHAFTPENTRIRTDGKRRSCRACDRERMAAHRSVSLSPG